MQDKDFKFLKMAQFEIESIKRKCTWVKDLRYNIENKGSYDEITLIYFDTVEGRQLLGYRKEKENSKFELSVYTPSGISFFNKNFSTDVKRMYELAKIQEELKEIASIGFEIYNIEFNGRNSVSGNFKINYRPEIGLFIHNCRDLVTVFPVREYQRNSKGSFYGEHPIIKINDNSKVRKKILIRNNYE
jgi:hypothetical protein